MSRKLIHQILVLLICVAHACRVESQVTCYMCANYDRADADYTYSSTCDYPITGDQSSTCSDTYCFTSSVVLADLSTALIKGCADNGVASSASDKLIGYGATLSFCNSGDYCNSSSNNKPSLITLVLLIIPFFIALSLE